jgi:hypothetical protein
MVFFAGLGSNCTKVTFNNQYTLKDDQTAGTVYSGLRSRELFTRFLRQHM